MKTLLYSSLFILVFLAIEANQTFSSSTLNNADSTEYCIVSNEKIEGSGIKYRYLNQDVKFCCEGCQKAFMKNPAKYIKSGALRCAVCDEDDAKTDLTFMHKGVKYYFCGKGCKTKFSKEPETYLKKYHD